MPFAVLPPRSAGELCQLSAPIMSELEEPVRPPPPPRRLGSNASDLPVIDRERSPELLNVHAPGTEEEPPVPQSADGTRSFPGAKLETYFTRIIERAHDKKVTESAREARYRLLGRRPGRQSPSSARRQRSSPRTLPTFCGTQSCPHSPILVHTRKMFEDKEGSPTTQQRGPLSLTYTRRLEKQEHEALAKHLNYRFPPSSKGGSATGSAERLKTAARPNWDNALHKKPGRNYKQSKQNRASKESKRTKARKHDADASRNAWVPGYLRRTEQPDADCEWRFQKTVLLVMKLKRWARRARRARYEAMNNSMLQTVGSINNQYAQSDKKQADSVIHKKGSIFSSNVKIGNKLLRVSVKPNDVKNGVHVQLKHYKSGKVSGADFVQRDWAHFTAKKFDEMSGVEQSRLAQHLTHQAIEQTRTVKHMVEAEVPAYFKSVSDLAQFLATMGVDPDNFGRNGAKELHELKAELDNNGAYLRFRKGNVCRTLHVMNAIVRCNVDNDIVLQQDLKGSKKLVGHKRKPAMQIKGAALTEVRESGEQFERALHNCAVRTLAKKLKMPVAALNEMLEPLGRGKTQVQVRSSVSFPGLPGEYRVHTVEYLANRHAIHLPAGWVWGPIRDCQ